MTFYWWSHWFWITLLSYILLFITIVQTYPSQEISLEYNQSIKGMKGVTKLYQSATTLSWATSPPTIKRKVFDEIPEKTILQNVTPAEIARNSEPSPLQQQQQPVDANDELDKVENINEDLEFKRSAESFHKTNVSESHAGSPTTSNDEGGAVKPRSAYLENKTDFIKLKRDESVVDNYTNFSSGVEANRTIASSDNHTTLLKNILSNNSSVLTAKSAASETAMPAEPVAAAPPSTPKIESSDTTVKWLNVIGQQLPPQMDSDTVTAPAQKVPFTLENVNKEEELRRAENEHRSRKSKVLSAEYKHINRYINFSTDSKSLLTRSASTASNEFENYDGNISSEALSIQRTYFLDAGAISAICFTIFGICCTVGSIGIVLYRRRYLNKPQTLSEPDSSVYIDDSTIRDNSDEMYSLDNDSFLNSLEAMTIQNYWTDTVKHTKL